MAKNKKSVSKSIPAAPSATSNQGIYGLNASKSTLKKKIRLGGSELTGTVK